MFFLFFSKLSTQDAAFKSVFVVACWLGVQAAGTPGTPGSAPATPLPPPLAVLNAQPEAQSLFCWFFSWFGTAKICSPASLKKRFGSSNYWIQTSCEERNPKTCMISHDLQSFLWPGLAKGTSWLYWFSCLLVGQNRYTKVFWEFKAL